MNPPEVNPSFENLLGYVKSSRGFDLTSYKRTTLMRRVTTRMRGVGIAEFEAYQDYLQVHPDEFAHLFDTVLINVTAFFRDPPAWEALAANQIPRIVDDMKPGEPIRVWSAGCSSGEEAFTIAMILAEKLGVSDFLSRVKIYATDIDEGALARARQAIYSLKDLEPAPAELVRKYFEPMSGNFAVRPDLRRSVVFGRHDLLSDAPISRIDLLVCRNTLMYMNSQPQQEIIRRFNFALKDRGFLFLGKAELLMTSGLFTPVDFRHRIFLKVKAGAGSRDVVPGLGPGAPPDFSSAEERIEQQAFASTPVAQIVISPSGELVLANDKAQNLFGITNQDIGKPVRDLPVFHRPAELGALIERASTERRPLTVTAVEHQLPNGTVQWLAIQLRPLFDVRANSLGVGVAFSDVTQAHILQNDLNRSLKDRERASQELQATSEELVTTNEELQSTVEELQTTNEELQSANEELEAMNEELQVSNEELRTQNAELRGSSSSGDEARSFLTSVMNSVGLAVVAVDGQLRVQVWNHEAENLWGMPAKDVLGLRLPDLDFSLPMEQLEAPLKRCVTSPGEKTELVLDALNRDGKPAKFRVVCTPRLGPGELRPGATVLFQELRHEGDAES
jgi:two-component system CheB/CheR fusion protein